MDSDEVWRTIDEQRSDVANLLDELSEQEWSTPSLCAAWTVRDVAAHLTLAHMGLLPCLVAIGRARGSLDRLIRDTAIRQARAIEASRRHRFITWRVGSASRARFRDRDVDAIGGVGRS